MKKLIFATLMAFSILTPTAALAHDEIAGTFPIADSTVAAGQITVSVSFDEDIMKTEANQGVVAQVTGPTGETVSNGCVAVAGKALTTPIDVDAAGTYLVEWRSISSDGHATEGNFKFVVENTNGYQASGIPAVSEECANAPTIEEPTDNSALIGLVIAIGLVAVGSIAAALRFGKQKPKG